MFATPIYTAGQLEVQGDLIVNAGPDLLGGSVTARSPTGPTTEDGIVQSIGMKNISRVQGQLVTLVGNTEMSSTLTCSGDCGCGKASVNSQSKSLYG